MELRADALDKIRGRAEIALLIASHQYLEIAVRVHESECLLAIIISTSIFAQSLPAVRSHSRTQFDPLSSYSMESAQKLRRAR